MRLNNCALPTAPYLVFHNGGKVMGQLRITQQGVGWKSNPVEGKESQVVTFSGSEIKFATWMRTARNFLLRLSLSKGQRHSFENLAREDLDALKKAIETVTNGNVHLDVKDVSLKGWNWGKADVQANDLAFLVQQRVAFEVPLAAISNSNMAGKNEVALEFSPPSAPERSNRPPDELMEMRFYIPQRTGKKRSGSKEDGEASDEDADDEGEEEEEDYDEEGNPISAAEAFHNAITTRAEIKEQAGDAIVTLPDVSVPTPRGRYDIELHADHLRLHGKTYDYKIPYKHIHRMFLLPKPDATFQQLIVGLEPPLRQGQTRYPWLVMQWPDGEEIDLTLNIDDDELNRKYPGLQKDWSQQTYIVVGQLMGKLSGREVVDNTTFRSVTNNGQNTAVKASVKAVQGDLHFLEKSMLFVAKQPILIDYNQISKASFSRVTGALRTCDITIKLNSEVEHTFTSINKDDFPAIKSYLRDRNVRVKEQSDASAMRDIDKMDLGSEDDDEEEQSARGAAKARPSVPGGDMDDDSEAEDEDFQADTSDEGSPSESDSEVSDGAVSDDMVGGSKKKGNGSAPAKGNGAAAPAPAKPKAAPKPKPTKPAATNGKQSTKSKETVDTDDDDDDVMDVDDEDQPPKSKKQKTD
ncbi:hypothetical protein QFC24_003796 [Naganishia onofrii]|uniref:Uncharacterized protein n=1 Tax=Naganishia onofrii TaxID=1851511 RepID=A0ACC2XHU0_9TREE|nr:hypothetical protein QFC24_003796 [Naganishia onofrii]